MNRPLRTRFHETAPSLPCSTTSRVVDVFLHYLKREGVRFVFGIPGGLLYPFFEALEEDDELQLVMTKHEEGAAFMADGQARVSGRLSVCAGTSGPGATNLLTGVACAFADGVPMVVVTGQPASNALGKGAAQETNREDIDIVGMFRPVTKYSTMVTTADSVGHHLRRALRLALTGRPGPVHLNLPVDLWSAPLSEGWYDPSSYRPESRGFDRSRVQSAANALIDARFPAILVGSGVATANARARLRTLAELLPARVATTPRAKGVFPEDHSQSLGVLGFAGHRLARQTLLGSDVDVLLTAGASLNETTTFNWNPDLRPSHALLQLDIDPDRVGRNYPVDVPLVGDAEAVLAELIHHCRRRIKSYGAPRSMWHDLPLATREHESYDDPALRTSDQCPVTPQRWRLDLEEVLPENAVIFSDIGGHMLFNVHHLCVRAGQSFVLNLGFGSMGHGVVAPIGAALAEPGRPVFAIVGDGCFTMNGMELLTAAEHGVPVIWIVENNDMHGITWHGGRLVGNRKGLSAARYKKPLRVAEIAKAMGVHAECVERPGEIQGAVRRALALGGPAVIEVRVDANIVPPLGDRAKSIAGFIRR
jgi:acetolactate synthase I/II/III large subunit